MGIRNLCTHTGRKASQQLKSLSKLLDPTRCVKFSQVYYPLRDQDDLYSTVTPKFTIVKVFQLLVYPLSGRKELGH